MADSNRCQGQCHVSENQEFLPFFSDIDECAEESHDCHVTSNCVNTAGSYNCSCNQSGYGYDGNMCAGILRHRALPVYLSFEC